MNREFKFRAFCKNDIEIKQPLLFKQRVIDDELFFVCSEDDEIMYHFEIPFIDNECWILQQYTGLKDKNGKEIFEGDIVDFNGKIVQIEWNEAEGCFWGGANKQRFILQYADMLNVIGNIYQNPELLTCTK